MINHFTFNGTSTAQLGLIVSGVSIFGAGSRKVEKAGIPGRNGDLQIELGGFNNYTVRYTVSITKNFTTTAQQIREWLLESKGYCDLADTYHPDEIRKACFNSDIEFTTSMLYKYGQASIQFDCLPERYLTTNTPITTTATADTTTDTTMSLSTVPTPINISLNGNTTQEGSSGKNKLPIEAYTGIPYNPSAGTTISPTAKATQWTSNGNGTFKMTLTSWEQASLITAPLTAGRYVARVTTVTAGMIIGIYVVNADGTANRVTALKNGTTANQVFQAATTLTAGQYFAFYIAGGSGECTIKEPMVEAGSTATAYEPHISPTNPQPIHNVSGDNKVIIASKNLLSNDWENDWQRGYWDILTGKFVSSLNWQAIKYYIPVQPNTTYYVYADPNISASIGKICQYDANKNFISYKAGAKNTTFTTSANVYFLTIYVLSPYKGTNISLSKSDTTTNGTYVPFTNQSYPINLGSIELNKIGTYSDYIYKNGSKWYVHKAIKKVTLDGTEYWASDSKGFYLQTNDMRKTYNYIENMLCDKLTVYTGASEADFTSQIYGITAWNSSSYPNQNWIYARANNETTPSGFKTWLSSNHLLVYYQLATPTNTEITDTTLINQLNNIEKAYSYNGTTNILQVSNDNGFMLEVVSLHGSTFNSNYKGEPIITVNSTGLIYLNGEVMEVLSAPVTINCQTMQCYNGVVNMNNEVRVNDFPEIKIGENTVGSSMALTITPNNWRH